MTLQIISTIANEFYNKNKQTICNASQHDSTSSTWYNFENHKWNNMSVGLLYNRLDEIKHPKLAEPLFRNNVINKLQELFHDSDFKQKLDEKHHLLHFNNGVYNLYKNKFRPGKPTDYISLSTNIDYVKYTPNSILNKYLSGFKEDELEKLIKFAISSLHGYTSIEPTNRKLNVLHGSGNNGKTIFINLLRSVLGDYSKIMVNVFLNSAHELSPYLAGMKGVRLLVFEETNNVKPENVNKLFEPLQVRPLFSDLFKLTPQYQLLLATNILPKLDEDTMNAIEIKTKFNVVNKKQMLEEVKNSGKEEYSMEDVQKLVDKQRRERMVLCKSVDKQVFMGYLLSKHEEFNKGMFSRLYSLCLDRWV
jgi:phage/plasmid-associated DNA primase